jgi:CO/xanthine dehydrogenase FAD-binding subunit
VLPFEYVRPETLADAIAILAEHGPAARLLAGGTDLLVRLRLGHIRPAVVVDLKRVTALRADIVEVDGVVRVGARTVMTDLIEDQRIRRHFPALVEAASVVGSVQIRNRATLAGNICNASPAADTAPALLVFGARVNLTSAAGARQVPVANFFVGPGKTVLERGEIVESIDLPVPDGPTGAAFGRVTRRKGVDLATINLCCLVSESGAVRFAYGAVGPRPFVIDDETRTLGAPASDEEAITTAIDRLVAAARPISDVRGSREYRSAMLAVMTRRTWAIATSRLRAR